LGGLPRSWRHSEIARALPAHADEDAADGLLLRIVGRRQALDHLGQPLLDEAVRVLRVLDDVLVEEVLGLDDLVAEHAADVLLHPAHRGAGGLVRRRLDQLADQRPVPALFVRVVVFADVLAEHVGVRVAHRRHQQPVDRR
jgi:hypothetical protein